ncbi:hypothetical protein L3Q82_014311 [Scortum barcoo]|uniref:Uncharacterized protein n=1 Tax=Scortum barcoo TaxID=214431 RepID=A0ACB8VX39_9TELE|nr:hypothetical protein L3Q82_014311 [Scortum barcoo]
MEEEMQQLRELMLQLKADNERLRQEQAALLEGSGGVSSPAPVSNAPSAGASAVVTERLVVIPRDRKCPMFNGKTGIGIAEWIEELQACVRARRLSVADQALFIFDHLEGEAKEEIKFRSSGERGDPARVLAILKELYGCTESYVTLQQAFFSQHQLEAGKLKPTELPSHSSVGESIGSQKGAAAVDLIATCPNIDVSIGEVIVSCLVDTGSMVSTMTESFFQKQFAPWGFDRLRSCHWLQLRAANGLAIPYIGYLELDVELCGKVMPRCGILVVKDAPGAVSSVPGVLGMNVPVLPTALWGIWSISF